MKKYSKEELLEKYKGDILGYLDYKEDESVYVDDLIKEDVAIEWIAALADADQSLTEEGAKFILDYYDLEDLVSKIRKKYPGFVDGDETLEKGVASFIEIIVYAILRKW